MKVKKKDLFHGAALTQIVEDPRFTALNKADEKYGHYQVNHNKRLLVKHASNDEAPWIFTIQPDDIDTVVADISSDQDSFLCLVCGQTTICILTTEEFETVVDTSGTAPQRIKVECPPASGMRVSGSNGSMDSVIPHNAFPRKIFSDDG